MENKPNETVQVTITAPDARDLSDMREFIQKQLVAWAGTADDGRIIVLDSNKGFLDGRSFRNAEDVSAQLVAALYVKNGAARIGFLDDKYESEEIRRVLGTYWLILQGDVETAARVSAQYEGDDMLKGEALS
jgi:hypothetical protein